MSTSTNSNERKKLRSKALPTDMERPLEEFSDAAVSEQLMTEAARRKMIEEAAYYRAQQRGFEPGHEVEDWLSAEAEIVGSSLQRTSASSDTQRN